MKILFTVLFCLCVPLMAADKEKPFPEDFKSLKALAENGDARAQLEAGNCLRWGYGGVEKDLKATVAWYLKAAEQGHPGAQFNLGTAYMSGSGVKENQEEAIKWWRRAAEKSDAMSQAQLGKLYWKGGPVPKDKVRAFAWFSLAARNGAMEGMLDIIEGDLPDKAQIDQAMTPEQITKAQALIKEMIKKNPKLIKLASASL